MKSPSSNELFTAFDIPVQKFMDKYHIHAGVLAVTAKGKELIRKGYGTDKDTVMRIASITKPITKAAIKKLVKDGKLTMDTKAFPLIDLKPIPGEKFNPELNQITVGHLFNHQGGWDREFFLDPTLSQIEIAAIFGKPESSVTATDLVRFMLSKPLQFKPGSKSIYCNFGFVVLGRVIEKVSGQTYETYIRENIMLSLGINSIQVRPNSNNQTILAEATYEVNVGDLYDPYKVNLEMMNSAGGLVSTAIDLCKFMEHYWLDGDIRKGPEKYLIYSGGMTGTRVLVLQKESINVAILFNKRGPQGSNDAQELADLIEKATHNLV